MTIDREKLADAFTHLLKEEYAARDFGFNYPNIAMIIDQVQDESSEVLDAVQNSEGPDRIQEEVGDLIHAAIAVCCFQGYDISETVKKTALKFESRMNNLKKLSQEKGLNDFNGLEVSQMLELWKEAKKRSQQ